MIDKIRLTFKHTLIYSVGNIATKLIGIILLPLYTAHITVSDYGILGVLEISILILSQVLMLGQGSAFIRFYDISKFKDSRKSLLFTILIFLIFIGVVFNLFGRIFSSKLARIFSKPKEFELYINLSLVIIGLKLINKLILSSLRAQGKPLLFAVSNIIKLFSVMSLNIYFVAFIRIGIKGILLSYLIGEVVLILILLPYIKSSINFTFASKFLFQTLTFGFPLIFSALAGMILNMGDRYVLKILGNYKEVGLYNLGYKIAGVLNMVFIQSFRLGLRPVAYKIFNEKGDKKFYSKMLTYSMFILIWFGLGISIIGKELIKTLALNSEYWLAYSVVPYIILGYIFNGARSVVNISLYLTHKTSLIAYTTIGAAILNILLNFLLIPKYHIIGAALATIISFMVLYFISYSIAQKQYNIPYENKKIFLMLIIGFILFIISSFTTNMNILSRFPIKFLIFGSFPVLLYLCGFFDPVELRRLLGSIRKWSDIRNIKNYYRKK